MQLGRKAKIGLAGFVVVALLSAWQSLNYLFAHGYSNGSRSGVIRKVSVKGPPYCKYLSAEMSVQGSLPGQATEVWEFSIDSLNSPLVQALHDVERLGQKITIDYRQDKAQKLWWRCNPSEYFMTAIEK